MRLPIYESLDINLSQSIDEYRDMGLNEALSTIRREWPEQMAALLILFELILRAQARRDVRQVIERPRKNGRTQFLTLSYLHKDCP